MILEMLSPPTVEEMKAASGVAKTAAADWGKYCKACRKRYEVVSNVTKRIYGSDVGGKVFLDWGAAVGGVATVMQHELSVTIHAADVDEHSMTWMGKANPAINCVHLVPGQRLPFSENTFDLIYGISVLTHIPPDWQEYYLAELSRVCKINGAVVLTIKSYACCDYNKNAGKDPAIHPYDRDFLKMKRIIYNSYKPSVLKSMDFARNEGYGITYHSKEYVQDIFGRFFEVERIDEAGLANQDVVTLRKR